MGMPNKKNQKKKRRKKSRTSNFFADAGRGCHIVRMDSPSNILEWEQDFELQDFEGQDVPDIAIDPERKTLSLCNVDNVTKVAYVTVYETECYGRNKDPFLCSTTTDNDGITKKCLTFIVLCPPMTFCHLCQMETEDVMAVQIESDVQPWTQHPSPHESHPKLLHFPLDGGPFLCTQGEGGHLTHFFSGNLHAIDFRCPVGTPLLAVADGVVLDSTDKNNLTGIAVSNLFTWNSILLKIDTDEEESPLFVEYVHIQSAAVKMGDRVCAGDIIGTSGSVGFSPEPHLHFAAYKSDKPDASTVRVQFKSETGRAFLPRAGSEYSNSGPVELSTNNNTVPN